MLKRAVNEAISDQNEISLSFDELLTVFQPRLYFFIRSMVFNPDDARDVLQDVNMVILRKKATFEPGSDFKSWTFAIARFECLSYLHKYRKSVTGSLDPELLANLSSRADERSGEVDFWLISLEQCSRLLDAETQALLDLRYRERVPLEMAALRLETTVGALKQKLIRARTRLRDCILKRKDLRDAKVEP
jgi:RNA polymerase sigma-70 factor (ECF subfamily)